MRAQLDNEDVEVIARRVVELLRHADHAPDRWLSTRAAAEYAGCTVTALHKATAAREVEFRQDSPGGKCWFRRKWIDAWRGL